MNKKNLFLSLLFSIIAFVGYSQCENNPNIPFLSISFSECIPGGTGGYQYYFFQQENDIINSNANYTVTFHLTQQDADNGTNNLLGSYFTTDPIVFDIYARVTDTPTGCVGVASFQCVPNDIYVNPPSPLVECDTDTDGFAAFNLESKTAEIASGNPNMVVTYHVSQEDADANVNQLVSPYTNTQINNQIVFARGEDFSGEGGGLPCYEIVLLELDVSTCDNLGRIKVNAYLDANANGIKDVGEAPFRLGKLSYTKQGDPVAKESQSQTGTHIIYSDKASNSYDLNYSIQSAYSSYYTATNTSHQGVTVPLGDIMNIDIPVQLQQPYEDIEVNLVSLVAPRPGFDYTNKVTITNNGSSNLGSGSVDFNLDLNSQFVNLSGASTGVTANPSGNVITISYPSIDAGASVYAILKFNSAPTVPLGTLITNSVSASIIPGEINPVNNVAEVSEVVIGSYDPNDIMESHGPDIIFEEFTSQDYLYYTIRFQNVGTAEAIHVRIEDVIDPLLDVSTLEIVGSSHNAQLAQDGNNLTWKHDFINLPASQDNEPASHGYVHYKIKPTAGYAVGTIIPNKADIYFDFNAPVITNTFNTEFKAQCEGNPVLPETVMPANGCFMYPGDFHYDFFQQEQQIMNGNTNYMVTFHLSQQDADNNTNVIFSPHIVPTDTSMFMVYARVEDLPSGCVGTISFECFPGMDIYTNIPTPLEVCDDNNDGYESFDLTSKDDEISIGNPDYAITYHETENDAMNDMNPLASPYTNTQANTQVVFARVKNTMGDPTCPPHTNYTVVQLTLQANECLSVDTFTSAGFSMYPNPVSDALTITSNHFNTAELILTTIQGKVIINKTLSFTNAKAKLDVSQLPRGLYFAKLQSANKSVVEKLMIK